MACRVMAEVMGVPGWWCSSPMPMKARILSVSVMATAPTPVSSWMMLAILVAGLGGEALAHDADGAVGDIERLGGEDPENFSYICC